MGTLDKEVIVMKRLANFSSLVALGVAVAVFAPIALVDRASAGSYVYYEDHDGSDPYYYSDSGNGWSESAGSNSDSSEGVAGCDASADTSASIYLTGGVVDGSAAAESWADASIWWHWEGGGTPSGGTLSYTWYLSGSVDADGEAHKDSDYSTASASSGGGASSGSTGEGLGGAAGGSVSGGSYGLGDGWVSDQEHGTGWGDDGWEWYEGHSYWCVEDSDEQEFDDSTWEVGVSVSASCNAQSSSVAGANENYWASASSRAGIGAHADITPSFP